jgi:hypothetical protein
LLHCVLYIRHTLAMENSFTYLITDSDGKEIGHLITTELLVFQIKIAHLYNLDKNFPHVFDGFPFDQDIHKIAHELLLKSGNRTSFQLSEGMNL